ncbi:uncharacterized [Tachysurus ichikawai]
MRSILSTLLNYILQTCPSFGISFSSETVFHETEQREKVLKREELRARLTLKGTTGTETERILMSEKDGDDTFMSLKNDRFQTFQPCIHTSGDST